MRDASCTLSWSKIRSRVQERGADVSYLYFTSYARDNRKHQTDDADLRRFVDDLQNEVRQLAPPATDHITFFDTRNIEAGSDWPQDLSDALRTSRLCVCLFSPSYFNSKWCGKEFQVFRERREAWMKLPGNAGKRPQVFVPVLWITPGNVPPQIRDSLQEWDDSMPSAYRELGVRQLMRLNAYRDDYFTLVRVLAQKIVAAAAAAPLPDLPGLRSLDGVSNAFEELSAPAGQGALANSGGVGKACFVFVAGHRLEVAGMRQSVDAYGNDDGWDWRPYHPASLETIGALAQQVAGQLGLRFQELPCDAGLAHRLLEAKAKRVPIVLMTDAWTSRIPAFQGLLREYDDLNLSNCAMLVPWNESDAETVQCKVDLQKSLRAACPQKTLTPPPNHYWESITSCEELRNRTIAALEEVRMRLMQIILNEAGEGDVRRAQSDELASLASEQGISLQAQPHLQNNATGAPGV